LPSPLDPEPSIQRFVDKHRNEIMHADFDLVRLLGWTDQYDDDDYYYVLQRRTYGIGNRVTMLSCVGRPVPFKLPDKDRKRLSEIWDLNDCGIEQGRKMAADMGIIIK